MKRSLITGGCGFIGSHLVDTLINKGHQVYVIDNLSSECNEQFHFNKEATYLHEDIKNYDKIEHFFKNVDYVFHLAAESRIQPTLNRPQETCMTNFVGTCNVLEAAKNSGVSRFFYSSTSSAYGRKNCSIAYKVLNKPCELREDMPRDCLNPYSVSKVAAEDLCKIYSSLWNLNTITFRYFNVYGERQPTKGKYAPVLGLFIKQKNENKPMTIVGDGKQRRDFTHVSDIVKANILAMEAEDIAGISGEIFNVGTGTNHSMLEIASMIGDKVEHLPPRLGEAQETLADISKISHYFGYQPSVAVEDWISKNK